MWHRFSTRAVGEVITSRLKLRKSAKLPMRVPSARAYPATFRHCNRQRVEDVFTIRARLTARARPLDRARAPGLAARPGRTAMFSHVMVGSSDIARSRRFYDAVFGAVGGKPAIEDDKGRLIYLHNGGIFMVSQPIDGQPATHANGGTIGFAMDGPAQASAWHDAGVEAGGQAIEEPPGVRDAGFGAMYLAYLRDPDGNKLCALHRMPPEG
jgi:catechol 2,3-dioxygenase-like lactoylglutathione lyase family enzyme